MNTWLTLTVLVLVILIGCGEQPGSDIRTGTLNVLVTDSHLPLIRSEADGYHHVFSGAEVHTRGTTTREAIVHLLDDSVQCIVVDRPLNAEEKQAARQKEMRVVETEIARDAVALLVHSSNTLASISRETLGSIVAGTTKDWREIPGSRQSGPIELCLTGRNSGLYELVTQFFFKLERNVVPTFVAPSQNGVFAYVAARPLAIGVISFAIWKDTTQTSNQRHKASVRLLDLQGGDGTATQAVKLHQTSIYDRVYPLVYSLYIYTSEKNPGMGQGFSTFVAGQTGQKIFLDAGLVPKTMPYRAIQLTQE